MKSKLRLQIIVMAAFVSLFVSGLTAWGVTFKDLKENDQFFDSILYIADKGIVSGYVDGTFRAENRLSRAEFLKILVLAKLGAEPTESAKDCFSDVKATDWFSSYVCWAKDNSVVKGYEDGNFRPNDLVSLAMVSKLVAETFSLPVQDPYKDDAWYVPYVHALTEKYYIPETFGYFSEIVKRGEIAEILWRLLEEKEDQGGVDYKDLKTGVCQDLVDDVPYSVNMKRVRATWISWNNEVRVPLGLKSYISEPQLSQTAVGWSDLAKKRGFINHKRDGQTAYYDYKMIESWFAGKGLTFENVNRATFTENIGWGYYKCDKDDCTDALIKAIRSTFDFFMSEKGKAYSPHYKSIVKPEFREIGLGIAVDVAAKKYYLTVHYGTDITSNPVSFCP